MSEQNEIDPPEPSTPPDTQPVELVEDQEPYGRSISARMERRIILNVPDRKNPRLRQFIDLVNADDEIYALWLAANVNAIERLGMTDHGPVHVKIVMNIAVKLFRLLSDAGVQPSLVTHYDLDINDAEIVVAAAALFHDTGMSIHRIDHENFSLFVAQPKLKEIFSQIYDVPTATIMRAETLHAIIGHRSDGRPLTIEAGVVRVADSLDMAKGRSRIPFAAGSASIHSISAAAIEEIRLEKGDSKPIRLVIEMSNSAGVFQLDQLFREKLAGSGLEPYIELEAHIAGESEKRLFQEFRI